MKRRRPGKRKSGGILLPATFVVALFLSFPAMLLSIPFPSLAATALPRSTPCGFHGYVSPGVRGVIPRITLSRTSGEVPFAVHVSAMDTAAPGSPSPYDELEYSWDFGDPSGTETFTHPVTGRVMRAGSDQKGPEASYVYSRPGKYPITLTVRAWTGSKMITEKTSVVVMCLPWTGEDRYFDPEDGDDGNDGMSARTPWKSWGRLKGWLEGGDGRRTFLKRGTVMTATDSLVLAGRRLRMAPYGHGPNPVIRTGIAFADPNLVTLWANNRAVADYLFEGIDLDGTPSSRPTVLVYGYAKEGEGISMSHIAFLRCRFRTEKGLGLAVFTGQGLFEGLFFSDCRFDHGRGSGSALAVFPGSARWLSVTGGSFTGGEGDMLRDHHIYPSGIDHMLFRWISFGRAVSKNFCINTDARREKGTTHVLIDGVNCTGTMNGIDMSNADNTTRGRLDHVILQSSAVHHTGAVGSQSNALLGYSVRRYTIRDSIFYGNRHREIGVSDPGARLMVYRNVFVSDGSVVFSPFAGQKGLFTDNLVVSNAKEGHPVAAFFFSSSFAIDRNRYRLGSLFRPFRDLRDGTDKTFREWQAAGFDRPGGSESPYSPWSCEDSAFFAAATSGLISK